MNDNIEELKASTRKTLNAMKSFMENADINLLQLQVQKKVIYLNGMSEEVKKEALAAKDRIKTRELNVA